MSIYTEPGLPNVLLRTAYILCYDNIFVISIAFWNSLIETNELFCFTFSMKKGMRDIELNRAAYLVKFFAELTCYSNVYKFVDLTFYFVWKTLLFYFILDETW